MCYLFLHTLLISVARSLTVIKKKTFDKAYFRNEVFSKRSNVGANAGANAGHVLSVLKSLI